MVEEGFAEVVVMVISTGMTERPITVFFTTSDVTATGEAMELYVSYTLSTYTSHYLIDSW